jgi:endonuclease YncB( thermonuclease family)
MPLIGPSTPPVEQWWRKVLIRSIHDGDTLVTSIDVGFDIWTVKPLRVFGVNAPELKNADGSGKTALAFTSQWVSDHASHGGYLVRFISWDKYNPRFDGILICGQGHCLNDALLEAGMATPMKARMATYGGSDPT